MRSTGYRFDAFLYAYLTMLGGSVYFLFYVIAGSQSPEKAGETLPYQIVWLCLYLVLAVKLAIQRERIGALIIFSAAVSLTASGAGIDSWIKFAMYLMTIAGAALLATSYEKPVDQLIESLYRLGAVVLVVHILAYPIGSSINWDVLDRPTLLGTMPYAGMFGHKNLAGSFFAMIVLVCLVKILSPNCTNRPIAFLLLALSALMLLLAGATGALMSLCVAAALTIGVFLLAERKNDLAAIYAVIAAGVALVIVIYGVTGLFALLGRDLEFTGRTELWSVGTLFFWQRPILGYGFANFFNADGPASAFWSMMPGHSEYWSFDNSYLEIGLQLGIIGAFFFGLVLFRALFTAFRFTFSGGADYKYGPLALLIYILVSSFFDSYILLHNYVSCFIIFWAYFGLQPELAKRTPAIHLMRRWAWRDTKFERRFGSARSLTYGKFGTGDV
jgi:exopolysaccharide production protein ExoQ